MSAVYLLRHCMTRDSELNINGSQTDTPLSEKGRLQALSLVPVLSKYTFDLIIVSPLQRTKQTIEPYLSTLKNSPLLQVEPLTIERDLGKLTNSVSGDGQIPTSIAASGQNPIEWTPPEGESLVDVYKRACQFYSKILTYPQSSILICSHQSFLRCLELIISHQEINEHTYNEIPKMDFGELKKKII